MRSRLGSRHGCGMKRVPERSEVVVSQETGRSVAQAVVVLWADGTSRASSGHMSMHSPHPVQASAVTVRSLRPFLRVLCRAPDGQTKAQRQQSLQEASLCGVNRVSASSHGRMSWSTRSGQPGGVRGVCAAGRHRSGGPATRRGRTAIGSPGGRPRSGFPARDQSRRGARAGAGTQARRPRRPIPAVCGAAGSRPGRRDTCRRARR